MELALLLLGFVSAVVLIKNRSLISHFIIGGICGLPLLLIDPLLRIGYFEQLTTYQLFIHFGLRALFTFLFAGLSAISYEIIFAPIFLQRRGNSRHALFIVALGVIATLSMLFLTNYSLAISVLTGLTINLLLLLIWRVDLLWDAIFSAIGTGILYAILFTVVVREPGSLVGLWFTDNLSGLTLAGLPIEELLIISLFGAFFGPIYIAIKSRYEQ